MADPSRVSAELSAVGLENVEYGRSQAWRLPGFATAAASLVRAVIGRRGLEGAMARIEAPTLVLWGDRDRLVGRPVIERIRRLRPDWVVEELDGVGHAPMMEAPEHYIRSVASWLAETPPVPSTS
jgi:pimeloyl-ACP methyl ester carboxylesterase